MSREEIIKRTIKALENLPDEKAKEIADFADFLLKKYEGQIITEGIQKLVNESSVYEFLWEEDEIYKVEDINEKYK